MHPIIWTGPAAALRRILRSPVYSTVAIATIALVMLAIGRNDTLAHSGATGIVKQRMDIMEATGEHAKTVGDMLKHRRALDAEAVRQAAENFIELGGRIPELFPDTDASRSGAKTEALPAIWEDRAGFEALAARLVDDSRALAAAAAELPPDAAHTDPAARQLRMAFFRAAKNCSRCHERFRMDSD